MKKGVYVILLLMLVIACTPSVPSQYIQPGEMEDLLYDYYVAQAMAMENSKGGDIDYLKNKYFLGVLKKYNCTQADFDSSMVWYYSHLDWMKKIVANVNERLSDESKMLGASGGAIGRYSQFTASGDTANIWTGSTNLLLIPRPTMNRFDFTVTVDTSFYKGDSFVFQFMSDHIWQTGSKDAVVCILTKYEGDSIVQTVNHISVSGIAQIRVPANHEKKLKEMRGFIYLTDGGDESDSRRLMFISELQLIRFHNKENNNEQTNNDTAKTDSIQRVDNARGETPDTAGRGTVAGQGSEAVPATSGTPQNRMVPRKHTIKDVQ